MFQFQESVSETEVLSKMKASRDAEPVAEPTAEPEAVDVSEDTPAIHIESEAPAEEVTEEAEESSIELSEDETTDNDDEDLYVEYKGREINLKDVEMWEQGHLMQADYTRKTQELSDSRKAVEAQQAEFASKQQTLNDKLATIEAMIEEDTKTPEEIAELREYEPEKYIDYIEKQNKRKDLLKAKQPVNKVDVQAVSNELFTKHPEWIDGGKQTEQFTKDMQMMNEYAQSMGYANSEIPNMQAHHYETMLDAAKYRALKNKTAVIEKKVRKAPVSTRPKQAAKPNITDEIKKQEALVRKTGRPEDFVKLRKLKRQLNS
jgi:hypothetical protein